MSQRNQNRRPLRLGLTGVAAFASVLAIAEPALADVGRSKVTRLDSATITVRSDGESYTSLVEAPPAITGAIEVEFDAEVAGRVTFWEVWAELQAEDGSEQGGYSVPLIPWVKYESYGHSRSYDAGNRPRRVHLTVTLNVPRAAYDSLAISACNALAYRLRNRQGLGNQEIFSQDRMIRVRAGTGHRWEMSGAAGIHETPPWVDSSDPHRDKVRVVCQKAPTQVPPVVEEPAREKPEVKTAEILSVDESSGFIGGCTMKIDARITTNKTHEELRFRYVSDQGHQSDIKTVNTGGGTLAILQHEYDLPSDGDYSGKVRIEGVSSNFVSAWKNYDLDCIATPNDLQAVLPPKAFHLEAIATADEVVYQGRFCPAKVKVWGIVKGRSKAQSGTAWLVVNGKPKVKQPFVAEDGQTVIVEGEQELSWDGSFKQDVNLGLYLMSKAGPQVGELEKTQTFECRAPNAGGPGDRTSDASVPEVLGLTVVRRGEKTFPGYVCPERMRVDGSLQSGNKPLKGSLSIFVGGTQQQKYMIDLPANTGNGYGIEYELSWNPEMKLEQTLLFTIQFANQHGHVVKTAERMTNIACREVAMPNVVGGASGGLSAGRPQQQAGRPSTAGGLILQPAATFAVEAPRGSIKSGRIELSGGKADAKYLLRFYRKTGKGYQHVRSAKLPRLMTGRKAAFKLAALTGGRSWRLEVCPAGSKNRKVCKIADFQVPSLRTTGKAKTPKKPASTKVFIMPGLGN